MQLHHLARQLAVACLDREREIAIKNQRSWMRR